MRPDVDEDGEVDSCSCTLNIELLLYTLVMFISVCVHYVYCELI